MTIGAVEEYPVNLLVGKLKGLENRCIEDFGQLLDDCPIDDAWISAMVPDPLPENNYHRRLLYKGSGFEVVLATWPEGAQTMVHDHGRISSVGMVRVLTGSIFNHIYEKNEDRTVKPRQRQVCETGELIPVPNDLVHVMGYEAGSKFAMSLHIYCPNLINVTHWDPGTLKPIKMTP